MAGRLQLRRGTLAGLNSAALANNLLIGEPLFLTDSQRLGVAVGTSAYKLFQNAGEPWTIDSGFAQFTNTNEFGLPTVNTRSPGTRIVLYPSLSSEFTDFAIGLNNDNTMWFGVGALAGTNNFRWYGAETEMARLSESGFTLLNSPLATANNKQVSTTEWVRSRLPLSATDRSYRALIQPGSASTITQSGIFLVGVGTFAHPQPAAGSALTEAYRFTLTSAATVAAFASLRSPVQTMWRGNAVGKGGFSLKIPFGTPTLQAGIRAFAGINTVSAAATNVDPLTTTAQGKVGMAINTNTGNWNLIHNVAGSAPTVVPLGANFPVNTTTWYELVLTCDGNNGPIVYTVYNRANNQSVSGSLTTNIPANTTFFHFNAWMTNNTTAAAVAWAFGNIYMDFA